MKTLEPFATLNEEYGTSANYLAFSSHGLLASQAFRVCLWDPARSGDPDEPLVVVPGGYGRPRALTWSPDGSRLATGCERRVVIWDIAAIEQVGSHQHDGTIEALAWCLQGHLIASCSLYGQMHLWHVGTGQTLREERFHLSPTLLLWSPDGTYLAANPFTDKASHWQVQMWDVEMWSVRYVLDDGKRRCDDYTCGAFSPQGEHLALGTKEGYVQIWSVKAGNAPELEEVFSFHQGEVSGLVWSPNGRFLLSGSKDQHVALWNPATGDLLYHAGCRGEDNWVEDVAWWSDVLAACDAHGCITLYRAPSGVA